MNSLKHNERINEEWLDIEHCNVLWNVCQKKERSLDYLDNGEWMISWNEKHIALFKECENAVFFFMAKSDPVTEESLLAWEEEWRLSQEYEHIHSLTPQQIERKYKPEQPPASLKLIKNLTQNKNSLLPDRLAKPVIGKSKNIIHN